MPPDPEERNKKKEGGGGSPTTKVQSEFQKNRRTNAAAQDKTHTHTHQEGPEALNWELIEEIIHVGALSIAVKLAENKISKQAPHLHLVVVLAARHFCDFRTDRTFALRGADEVPCCGVLRCCCCC